MTFLSRYPVSTQELLLAPIVFRAGWPALARSPLASAAGMKDLAGFGGHGAGAIRTALSRLRASGLVEAQPDADGVERFTLAGWSTSVRAMALGVGERPQGIVLAVYAFQAEDHAARQVVRDALRLHGFQKLAQNVYVQGASPIEALEARLEAAGVADHVWFFPCDRIDARLGRRLVELFDLDARRRALEEFDRDLAAFLGDPDLDDRTFARRMFYAGPVHHRITFLEEPPLPSAALPPDYPLDRVRAALPSLGERRPDAVRAYFEAVHR